MNKRHFALWAVCLAMLTAAPAADAAPTIRKLSINGLQSGGKTTIVFEGAKLLPAPRVILPFPIARQTIKPGAKANRVEIEIALDSNAAPGIHHLRLANSGGISNPVAVGVDALRQKPFATQLESLPVALHGVVAGGQVLRTEFSGAAGQEIIFDVEAQRLGSPLRPVVRLYDSRGAQVAWSGPRPRIGGDARFTATLPEDGTYAVELHDLLYRAAGGSFFRLKIGHFNYADLAYPIGVKRGDKTLIALASGTMPPQLRIEIDGDIPTAGPHTAQLPPALNLSGAAPRVVASNHPEVVEAAPAAGQLQELPHAPSAINGRLAAAGEADQYLLPVKAGAKLRFEVTARQVGSPLDGVLSIRRENGQQLAANDDLPSEVDPRVDVTVPDGVEKLVVVIRDLLKRGGDDFIYRIAVRDLSEPDFSLTFDADRLNLPAGGTQVIEVRVARRGYRGPIELEVQGLPQGVEVAGNVIPAGRQIGLLTLTAPSSSPVHVLARIVGRGTAPNTSIVRVAQSAETPAAKYQPSLRAELGMALAEAAPISLAWNGPDEKSPLLRGGVFAAQIKLMRAEGAQGGVRLKLLTNQVPPKKKVKQNNRDVTVDDVERTLRLESEPQIGADQTEPTVNVLTPSDLPGGEWELVVVGELLAADNKTVLASAATPVRHVSPVSPVSLELTSEPKIEAKAGEGETGKLTGKITRAAAYNQPVTITLTGLPKELPAPSVSIGADSSEFELPVRFSADAKQGEVKNVKLVATTAPNPKQPKALFQSNELAVALNVVAGDKPAEKPAEPAEKPAAKEDKEADAP